MVFIRLPDRQDWGLRPGTCEPCRHLPMLLLLTALLRLEATRRFEGCHQHVHTPLVHQNTRYGLLSASLARAVAVCSASCHTAPLSLSFSHCSHLVPSATARCSVSADSEIVPAFVLAHLATMSSKTDTPPLMCITGAMARCSALSMVTLRVKPCPLVSRWWAHRFP